ncbi:MAG: efflux RND transporter permease subunit [Pseudomonadota bacterium]
MWISDTSVRRPVLALVLNALLLAFGLLSFERLPLREYPDIDAPEVTVETRYPGASAAVVENKITEILEDRLAGVEGIKSMSSQSQDGESSVRMEFSLERDIDAAANDVRDRVSRLVGTLPEEADPPEVQKASDDEQVLFWIHLVAPALNALELTDYVARHLEDRFAVLDGVARIRVSGQQVYSMRIWLDRGALVGRGLTVADIEDAIRAQNVELPAGTVKSSARDFVVRVERSYTEPDDFRELVVSRGSDGHLVRLGDVARVELASAEHRSLFRGNTESMVGIGVVKQSTANAVEVSRQVLQLVDRLNETLPEGMRIEKSYNAALYVEAAISEVYRTLAIAACLVVLVIFIFLGDPRSVLIPALTVPISLISTFTVLALAGYSINLLTLLALVLAIGLVVDDSIVVLENIHARMMKGESPLVAAYRGARQVGFAVVATTAVLVAVFVPISFMQGDIGRLFGEFAVTLAVAVVFSSIVALTLAPMIASKLLREDKIHNRLADAVESLARRSERAYQRILAGVLHHPWLSMAVIVASIAGSAWEFQAVPQEYTPREDRGTAFMVLQTPEGSSFDYTVEQILEVEQRLLPLVEQGEVRRLLIRAPSWGSGEAYNAAFAILVMADWDKRSRSTEEIVADARARVRDVAGASVFIRGSRGLGGGNSPPVQLVVGGNSYEELATWQDQLLDLARVNPGLVATDTDLKPTKPQLRLRIDRNRAGDLGVSVLDISRTLETLLGSRRVTTFLMGGREYDVIVEGEREAQRTLTDLTDIYVRSDTSGELIPLSNLVSLSEQADAGTLNRYNRIRAVTLSANLVDDYALGDALTYLEDLVRSELPQDASIDYKGESLEYKVAGSSLVLTFVMALLIVYLVMAAQFESLVHPLVILFTVPLALIGGLGGLLLFGQSLNIYSQVGLIVLIGLATKNGILIIEFINQKRDAGLPFEQAVLEGASRRLRPILMTAVTTVMGALPLVLASGPGHEARTVIGVVIMCGVLTATIITLLVIPAAYSLLARSTGSPGDVSRRLETELGQG